MSLTFGSQAKPALTAIGAPLLALAPAAAAAAVGVAMMRRLRTAPRRRRVVAWSALAAGTLLAIAVLMAGALAAHGGIEQLFMPHGWWDIGPLQLLAERLPEALRAAMALAATPIAAMPFALGLVVLGFLVAITLMLAAALTEPLLAQAAIDTAAGTLLVVVSAALGVYAAYVLMWLAAYLNFWAFAVMLIGLQRWRHGAI
jgi:hypothetical protein